MEYPSMASSSSMTPLLVTASCLLAVASAGNFQQDFDVSFRDDRVKISKNGDFVTLSLDNTSGSGFQSKNEYLFGKIDMQLKLVPNNSAGTVTTFYLKSEGSNWDEMDFEFLGNLTGDPYTLRTNVYTHGQGSREQQFHLWFDPTADFHNYSLLWNPLQILFYVDGTPVREFKDLESIGVPYPKSRPMRIYAPLWDAEDWATRGGLIKTDWTQAPFTASFNNFWANACIWASGSSSCPPTSDMDSRPNNSSSWLSAGLDAAAHQRLGWVQQNYMIYNYCTDPKRIALGFPPECNCATTY